MFLISLLLLMPLMHGVRAECKDEYRNRAGGLIHTACKTPNPECKAIASGISTEEKIEILEVHNKYRSQIASGRVPNFPPATNMRQLLWDDELADVAQAHANQCEFKHDERALRFTTKFPNVGQNLAYISTTAKSSPNEWSDIITRWFDEYRMVSPSVIRRFYGGSHGHFTQVVWADTSYIGCGLLKYKDGDSTETLYTCNYGPSGNVLRYPVYDASGAACSRCPAGTKCHPDTSLCQSDGKDGEIESGNDGNAPGEPSAATRISIPTTVLFAALALRCSV